MKAPAPVSDPVGRLHWASVMGRRQACARAERLGLQTMDRQIKQEFWPLCDLHHAPMRRVMLEEDSNQTRSYHACERPDCTRVFRAAEGYSDIAEGEFDESRNASRTCSACGAMLYLAEVNHCLKLETWECSRAGCEASEEIPSPASR